MKRKGMILCLAVMMVMMFSATSFAAGFGIEETTPKDGQTGTAQENMGVKVTFTDTVYNPDNDKANAKRCHLTGPKGKEVPSRLVFSEEEPNVMLVLADVENPTDIKGDTTYKLTIDKDFVSAKGDKLGKEFTVSFTTLNPKSQMMVSFVMMLFMVVVMVVVTKRGMNADNEAEKKKKEKEERQEKFNPYKVAKETGKSVDEVLAEEKKRQERKEAKIRRQEEKDAKVEARKEKYREEYRQKKAKSNNLKVAGPAPISAYSTYKASDE